MEKILQIFISTIIALIPVFQASADVAIPQNHEGTADNPLVDIKLHIKQRLEIFNTLWQKKSLVFTFRYADGTERQEKITLNDSYIGVNIFSLKLAEVSNITNTKKGTSAIKLSEDGLTSEIISTGWEYITDYDIHPWQNAYGFLPNIEEMKFYMAHRSGNDNVGSDDSASGLSGISISSNDNLELYMNWDFTYFYGCCKNEITGEYDFVFFSDMSCHSHLVNIKAPWYMTATDCTAPEVTWDAKITKLGQDYGYMETLKLEFEATYIRNDVTVRESFSHVYHIPYPKSDEGKAIVSQLGYVVP